MKKAKIIVLSGQSNAVGVGHTKCLGRSFGEAKIKEYLNGYDKVQIHYHSHSTRSEDFVATTKNCTEANKDTIGPELGIAEYFSQECPDDAYFIAKFAMGGASLMRDFLSPSSGGAYDTAGFEENCNTFLTCEPAKAGWCYTGLVSLLKDSIARLEAKGFACHLLAIEIGVILIAAGGFLIAKLQRLLEGGQGIESAMGNQSFRLAGAGNDYATFKLFHRYFTSFVI